MKHNFDFFKSVCSDEFGITLTGQQCDQFEKYYEILIERNKVMNLTSITDFDDVVMKHFIDSLYICKFINMDQYSSLIDIGTGAGFPGIPLKIAYPELKICLMDSLNKRIEFLKKVCTELNLQNIECVHERAEILGHNPSYREQYEIAVSRAVANLSILIEYCTPFIVPHGKFISYKAGNYNEELNQSKNALTKLNCSIGKIESYNLPATDIGRSLIIIKKYGSTPGTYPRKAGMPTRRPL